MSRSSRSFSEILIGPPLETAAAAHQSISKKVGLAVFASDALSSTAYATQEILLILALAGAGAFSLSIPIALAIAVLLLVLTISYRQTIHAYPSGGGAYIVSRDNLGETAAQVAAAALLTDYILTVAVSISSGVDQIISAVPSLLAWRIELAIAMVVLMAVINLRGVKESGRIFAVPTYIFLGSMALTLVIGFVRWATGGLGVLTDAPPMMETAVAPLTAFLVLRAFSSGCTALTGVEAISNGIPAFEEPRSHNAATTLTWMSIILGTIFISITFLAHHIGATPSETETVISQLGRAVWGRGWGQVGLLAATTLILIMAANTSFADFPRLAALAATDGFLPRQLAYRGSRLVFSWGITFLAAMAIFLLIILQANTSRLIPLYAIGVFLSFTLSQSGMVLRWLKVGKLQPGETGHSSHGTTLLADPQWRIKMLVNGAGGVLTAVVMVVFAVTKFRDGAWFVVILIPVLVMIFLSIHRHYQRVASQLSLGDVVIAPHASAVKTILLVDDVHAGTLRLVNFALSMGQPWEAVHVAIDPERTALLQQKWAQRIGQGELTILPSPYRSIAGPLRDHLLSLREQDPQMFIHLLLGQLAMPRYWEQLLHRNTNLLLDLVLRDIDRVIVTSIPYQISLRDQYLARLRQESKPAGNNLND